ncbi:acid phosphatase [Maribellus mangrovi]|uniref:acid phosphatase n=1 Tax=Maribellus mangrovi TaxID=3133146 RepID=UPI0030EECB37
MKRLLFVFILGILISGCVTKKPLSSVSLEIPEISKGILQGYLDEQELPNSLELVSPPPKEGSAAFALDQEIAAMYVASDDEARKEQAKKDAVLHFPEATEAFNIILNIQISEETTPNLYMILRRTLADAGLSTYAAKNHYQRERPFMVNNTPICTPEDEEGLRKDGSYPSGHTAIGWAWALILAEVFPVEADAILIRGKEFGISRNVCNVHWHSDVVAGRLMGAATVAKLHSNDQFLIDLEAAKQELKAIRNE